MPLRCALAVLMLAASANAAEISIAVLPFSGPRAALAREQLVKAVCEGDLRCLSEDLARRGQPDWEKIRATEVKLVVTGRVTGAASPRSLELEVLRPDESSALRQSLRLGADGKATAESVQEVDSRILELARATAPAIAAGAAPSPSGPPPSSAAEPPPADGDVALVEPLVTPPPKAEPPPAPPPTDLRSSRFPLVAIEAGLDLVRRTFQYRSLETFTLRTYESAPVIPTPRLRIEAHPFASSRSAAVGALRFEADLLVAIGLRTVNPDNDQTYATTFQRVDVSASWSTPLPTPRGFRLGPAIGYRYARFDVGLNAADEPLDGVVDVRYLALRGGVGAEYERGRAQFFARAEYVHPLGVGGIKTYFPDWSAAAFELEAGGGFRLSAGFELRGRVHYGRYALSFPPPPGTQYRAAGASDDYLGLALLMRYVFG